MSCFLNLFRSNNNNKIKDSTSSRDQVISELQNRLSILEEKIDTDNDGKISQAEMEAYLKSIIPVIDSDSDGIVTKVELQNYMENQMQPSLDKIQDLNLENERLKDKLARLEAECNAHKKEAENWEKAYHTLHGNFKEVEASNLNLSKPKTSHVSEDNIKEYVQKHIINNPEMNFKWIPDGPESKIWTFMLYRIMKSFDVGLAQAGIDLPGHKLTLAIRPDD